MTPVMTQRSRSAFGALTDDPSLDLLSSTAALLAACRDPDVTALANADRVALTHAAVRSCAGAFARLAADLLLSPQLRARSVCEEAITPELPAELETLAPRELWRMTVIDLAHAMQRAHEARLAVQTDPQFLELGAMLRQLTAVGERLATALEAGEPHITGEPHSMPSGTAITLPDDGVAPKRASQRRRPWFGSDAEPESLWPAR